MYTKWQWGKFLLSFGFPLPAIIVSFDQWRYSRVILASSTKGLGRTPLFC